MKFDITIKDATAADLTAIANVLNGSVDVKPSTTANAIKLQSASAYGKMGDNEATESPVVHLQQFGRFERQEVAAESTQASHPETDSTGLPWDERIHSSSKNLNQDGTWKKRRGVPELTVDKVEAELRGVAVDDTPLTPQIPQQQEMSAPVMPPLPQIPQQQATPVMPTLPPVPQVARDFNNALTRIQSGFKDGKMNAATIKEISDALGVSSITDINGNVELIAKAHNLLDGYGV